MKLYYSKGSCSLAIRILINELNLKVDFVAVNLKNKQTEQGQDFFKINIKGAVPSLQLEDGSILTENLVIQQYLADTHNGSALLPKVGEMQRYRVLEWSNFVTTELHKGCGPFFNPDMPADVKEKIFKPMLVKKLDWVEQALGKHKFIAGEQYSIADIYLWVVLSWLPHIGFEHKNWPHVEKYFKELSKRPAVHKSLVDEKLV